MARAQVAQLWELQQLDLELEQATAACEQVRRTLASDATRAPRATLAHAQRIAQHEQAELRAAEDALADTRERLARQESRLYGSGMGAKDLQHLEHEIAHLRSQRASQEDAVLGAMLTHEETEHEIVRLGGELADAARAQERVNVEARGRLATAEARLATVRADRERLAPRCGPELLARYEALRRAHGGRAVAAVRDRVCQGCHVTLTSGAWQHASTATDLPLCDNCGRILYVA